MRECVPISQEERIKCIRVVKTFNQIIGEGSCIADAGKFGFVYLQGYGDNFQNEFSSNEVFRNSEELFEALWSDVRSEKIWKMIKNSVHSNIRDVDDFLEFLSSDRSPELIQMRKELWKDCFEPLIISEN